MAILQLVKMGRNLTNRQHRNVTNTFLFGIFFYIFNKIFCTSLSIRLLNQIALMVFKWPINISQQNIKQQHVLCCNKITKTYLFLISFYVNKTRNRKCTVQTSLQFFFIFVKIPHGYETSKSHQFAINCIAVEAFICTNCKLHCYLFIT